jgi:hypothetical protein
LTRGTLRVAEIAVCGRHSKVQAAVDEMGMLCKSTRRVNGVNTVCSRKVFAVHSPEGGTWRREEVQKYHEVEEKPHDERLEGGAALLKKKKKGLCSGL